MRSAVVALMVPSADRSANRRKAWRQRAGGDLPHDNLDPAVQTRNTVNAVFGIPQRHLPVLLIKAFELFDLIQANLRTLLVGQPDHWLRLDEHSVWFEKWNRDVG